MTHLPGPIDESYRAVLYCARGDIHTPKRAPRRIMVARAGRPLYPVLSSPNMHRDPKPRKKGQDRQIPKTEAANLFRCAVDSPRQRTNWGKKKAPLRDRTGSTPQLLLSDWGRVKTLSWTWFVGWALSDGRTDGIASHPYWRRGSSATLLLHTVCTETSPHREATLGEKTWAPASPHSHGLLLIFFSSPRGCIPPDGGVRSEVIVCARGKMRVDSN
ncbi:hypothetical protein B0J15DRAFT_474287 [Fusarium solani]|uniref:Uncharacterized protein n=1 Tax=Fusarium solani TaxID=169388 RepID=A0A9P9RDU8_FUSSL|nr:uncharacterized protein B0J15DRAFT_474287 [Fusarium solani]KAH7275184.1 hypothetical protein B0J15DRAFT_474287 [Fusarium solani]